VALDGQGRLAPERPEGVAEGHFLGNAIAFFLEAKRAGDRGEKTVNDYQKKLDLFQRWLARSAGPEEVDVPYFYADADTVEAYAVHLRDGRASPIPPGRATWPS
jgi:hypothetical protein